MKLLNRESWETNELNTWVCISSPVTMFPTVLRAGISTVGEVCLNKSRIIFRIWQQNNTQHIFFHIATWVHRTHVRSSVSRLQTPVSITPWILSFVPSERYDSAQQASVKTSSSFEWIRLARAGRAGLTWKKKLGNQSILN